MKFSGILDLVEMYSCATLTPALFHEERGNPRSDTGNLEERNVCPPLVSYGGFKVPRR